MSRGLSAANEAAVEAAHTHEVTLVKIEFDTPIYIHSGLGELDYDGNTYEGVGSLGGISAVRESEALGPHAITLSIDSTVTAYIVDALESGNFYDTVTCYSGYRLEDNTLAADPWLAWRGRYEYTAVEVGKTGKISLTCQHDLGVLKEKAAGRLSAAGQTAKYAGDLGLEYVTDAATARIKWGPELIPFTGNKGGNIDTGPYDYEL